MLPSGMIGDVAAAEMAEAAAPAPARDVGRGERIELDRARRNVSTSVDAYRTRFLFGLGLLVGDLGVLVAALALRHVGSGQEADGWLREAAIVAPALLAAYIAGGYRYEAVLRSVRLKDLSLMSGVGAFAGLLLYKLLYQDHVAADVHTTVWTATGIASAPAFAAWVAVSRWSVRAALIRREAGSALLFIGPARVAAQLREALRRGSHRTAFVAFSDEPGADAAFADIDGYFSGRIRGIVLGQAVQNLPPRVVEDLVHARLLNIPILMPSSLFEELWERTPITMADHAWLLQEDKLHPSRSLAYLGLKRLIDVVVAAAALLLLSPLVVAVALAVRLTSPGPALFRQVRLGMWKVPFTIYKFRTMRIDAERGGARWASAEDPRVTPIGRFLRRTRIDELPQFWNVLLGHMSLVGPRPERPEFTDHLERVIPYYDLRHLVKPGITGWAQVCYPYGASVDDAIAKLEYEIYYIKRASMRFDLRIVMRTLAIVFGLRGR